MTLGYSPTNSWGSRFSASVLSCQEKNHTRVRLGSWATVTLFAETPELFMEVEEVSAGSVLTVNSASRLLGPHNSGPQEGTALSHSGEPQVSALPPV